MRTTTAVLLAAGGGTRLGLGPKALLAFRGTSLVNHVAHQLLRGGCAEVVVVVGAGADTVLASGLPAGCRAVVNPRWQEGMGASFALGISTALGMSELGAPALGAPALGTAATSAAPSEADTSSASNNPEEAAPDTVLVALVDQPGLTADLVARLLAAHRPGRIAAAGFRSSDAGPRMGNPAAAKSQGTQAGNISGTAGLHRGHPIIFDAGLAGQAAAVATGDSGARDFLRSHQDLIDLVDCSDLSDGADVDTPAQLHLLD